MPTQPETQAKAAFSRPPAPDLQEWIARYGGYPNIPWPEWDAAMDAYRKGLREWHERRYAE